MRGSLIHRSWCEVASHEDHIASIGEDAGCTSPVRVEVLDGRYRASALVEGTEARARIALLDVPLYGSPLTPAGARQLAAMLGELAAVADESPAGDVSAVWVVARQGDESWTVARDGTVILRLPSSLPAWEALATAEDHAGVSLSWSLCGGDTWEAVAPGGVS